MDRRSLSCYAYAVSLALLWVGCGGETNRKLFQRYEPQFAEKRQQFQRIASNLPPPRNVINASTAALSPKPVYDARNLNANNTEIVMYDQLLDPDIRSEGNNRLDLLLSGNLLSGMQWTGPKNPMVGSALGKHNPEMEQNLKQALAERYLVVLRPVSFVAPVANDESTFHAGKADIEGFVFSLPDQKPLTSFRYTAQSAERVQYSSREGDTGATRQSQLEQFAYSSLYEDARKKLKPLLEQATGGTFALER